MKKESDFVNKIESAMGKSINLEKILSDQILKKLKSSEYYRILYLQALKLHSIHDTEFKGFFSVALDLKSSYSYTYRFIDLLIKNNLAEFKKNPKKKKRIKQLLGLRNKQMHLKIFKQFNETLKENLDGEQQK